MNLSLRQVRKVYPGAGGDRLVTSIAALDIAGGEKAAVFGASGSGKSTFLNLISGMLPVTSGEIWIGADALHLMTEARRDAFRARHMGIIFQNFHLFKGYSALENVQMGVLFSGRRPDREKAAHLLDTVGLGDHLHEPPERLSTGQRQRVAIARALAHDPDILLADEPTGNLDPANRDAIMDLLFETAGSRTLIVVTHDRSLLGRFSRHIELKAATGS